MVIINTVNIYHLFWSIVDAYTYYVLISIQGYDLSLVISSMNFMPITFDYNCSVFSFIVRPSVICVSVLHNRNPPMSIISDKNLQREGWSLFRHLINFNRIHDRSFRSVWDAKNCKTKTGNFYFQQRKDIQFQSDSWKFVWNVIVWKKRSANLFSSLSGP